MVNKHEGISDDYTQSVPTATIAEWTQDIERWNLDHSSKPDPYEDITTSA